MTIRPSGSAPGMGSTSHWTPAGPASSTRGAGRSPSSSGDTESGCECSQGPAQLGALASPPAHGTGQDKGTRTQVSSPHIPPDLCPKVGGTSLWQSSERRRAVGSRQVAALGSARRRQAWRGMPHGTQTNRDQWKLHRGPLNEDVFSAQPCAEEKALHPSIQELTEQIDLQRACAWWIENDRHLV